MQYLIVFAARCTCTVCPSDWIVDRESDQEEAWDVGEIGGGGGEIDAVGKEAILGLLYE